MIAHKKQLVKSFFHFQKVFFIKKAPRHTHGASLLNINSGNEINRQKPEQLIERGIYGKHFRCLARKDNERNHGNAEHAGNELQDQIRPLDALELTAKQNRSHEILLRAKRNDARTLRGNRLRCLLGHTALGDLHGITAQIQLIVIENTVIQTRICRADRNGNARLFL